MRALVIRGHGDFSQLEVAEVPKPAVSGHADVLIRLRAAALNHLDLWTLRGLPGLSLRFPHTLGGDGAGVVEEVGGQVSGLRPGDKVMLNPGISCHHCEYCLAGEHSLCETYRLLGEHLPGTLAEYIVVPEQNVAVIPTPPDPQPELTWPEAAAFSLVTLTAWRMLMVRAGVRPGETVLIWGIGGGVSSTALKIAKLAGAYVIVTSSSAEKLDAARELGADVTVNHGTEDVVKAVLAATERRGVDVVIENVGEATWDRSLRLLSRRGRLVTCGATTGAKVTVDVRRLFWYQWTIMGSTMGSDQDFREVVRLLGQGHLRPTVDSVFPLDRGADALRHMERGEHFGKIVVEI
ncbi:MAG: zinc-binding dehydrogenase [Gemmatimonadales bacterium]|nr:zinc-binding dehydrogenase [Gemmatimonadales bacterium]NIN11093.1 zinc-binding dehydrogenase [Gemmatimonadales bacterium]NIN49690.1 zinc-binding dehydrogenase [Gemmatimonadales bacterium]NIP07154.1 zinc-binding dehydrogenase [Gemmatimonadales bacterium]NIQ99545.1 zinc-binding dehydrogenase [Gemmatimonadales bacterium]